ncbi:hypothetical protein MFLO_15698 [Listeria floridensis FSL S10-1187]|uniref:Uncharacterized protein n=1 Tax=Listeria floridensis FSL S10-1187 TaxID=1265817 RepID=A0ABP3AV72_9LIST|nr:hypothetical protein [Listeria floridensis]EUJ24245.1 hypothetical protein MFLO_15698 [Listeria floridensis FSL S10-1187]
MDKLTHSIYKSGLEAGHKQIIALFDPTEDYDDGEEELQDYIREALFSIEIALDTLEDLKPKEETKCNF